MSSVCGGQCDQDKSFAKVLQNVAKMLPHEISMSDILCHYKSIPIINLLMLGINGIRDFIFKDPSFQEFLH